MDILRVKGRWLLSMQDVFGVVRSDRVKETKDLFGMRDKRDQGYSKCCADASDYVAGHCSRFTQLTYHRVVLFAEKWRRKMDLRDSPFSAVLTEHPGKIYSAFLEKEVQHLGTCSWDSYAVQCGKEQKEREVGEMACVQGVKLVLLVRN